MPRGVRKERTNADNICDMVMLLDECSKMIDKATEEQDELTKIKAYAAIFKKLYNRYKYTNLEDDKTFGRIVSEINRTLDYYLNMAVAQMSK